MVSRTPPTGAHRAQSLRLQQRNVACDTTLAHQEPELGTDVRVVQIHAENGAATANAVTQSVPVDP
jgi:hypothetical protein